MQESERKHPVRLIDQEEVARMYSVSPRTINSWERDGKIPKAAVDRKNFKRWLYATVAEHIEQMANEAMMEAAR